MAIIAPFKGLTYNFKGTADLRRLVAPPYDVISESEQEAYYRMAPHNVIRLILGKKRTGDSDWDNRYSRAADYLRRWESGDILVRGDHPAMYLTSLTYDPGDGGGSRVRWGLIALVRIEDKGSDVILPHEETFSAHRVDRLKLMRACNAQFSQVFGLYDDPAGRMLGCIEKVMDTPPRVSFDLEDGSKHQMWIIRDRSIFQRVAGVMKDRSILIADGHHRYETARDFRNIMRARYGRRPQNRSYEFLMMYLCNMNDPGLTILPSHRLVKHCEGFAPGPFLERIGRWFEISSFPSSDTRTPLALKLIKTLEEKARTGSVIGFCHAKDDRFYLFSLKPGMRDEMGEDLHPSLKRLDVLVLSRLIFQKGLNFSPEDLDNDQIFHYDSDLSSSISHVASGDFQMAFLLNPTRIDHVKEVARNGLVMPRKSTYFYPKVLTGLVFNKIDPYERIQVP